MTNSFHVKAIIAICIICSVYVIPQSTRKLDPASVGRAIPGVIPPLAVLMDGRLSLTGNTSAVTSSSAKGDDETISVTTLQAPRSALRHYENAKSAFTENELDIAEKELKRALTGYYRFAEAWMLLGRVHEKGALLDEARSDYFAAASVDPNLTSPYSRLAEIAFENKNWPDVVRFTNEIIKLNSSGVSVAYLYNAAANFNLGNVSAAEQSARRFQSLDGIHDRPQAYLLLADILKQKGAYAEAAQQMRLFLAIAPSDPFAETVANEAARLQNLAERTNPRQSKTP